jgi:D-arabinose 1-dehydrogenase-like Zn-dependent alcohol dehydrogenase
VLSYQVIEHGRPLQSVLRDTPQPSGGEVLVRLLRSGVCHSDLHIWDGYFDLGGGKKFFVKDRGCVPPFTLGHEPYGRVEAVGPAAHGVASGGRFVVYPWIGCGRCAVCEAGQDNYCLAHRFVGISTPGAYASHLLVPDARYLVDAGDVDPSFAATLACSGLTTYSAICKLPVLGRADWVVVLGCGGLGLSAIAVLRALGIGNIIACDIDATKLAQARELGADATVDTRDADAAAQIGKLSGGNVAAAIDVVGMPATVSLGLAVLRKGGRLVLCGLFGGEITLSLPPIVQRAVGVVGSYVGSLQELRDVVALARSGRLAPLPVQTRPATEVNRSLTELKAGQVMGRVVLDFEAVTG